MSVYKGAYGISDRSYPHGLKHSSYSDCNSNYDCNYDCTQQLPYLPHTHLAVGSDFKVRAYDAKPYRIEGPHGAITYTHPCGKPGKVIGCLMQPLNGRVQPDIFQHTSWTLPLRTSPYQQILDTQRNTSLMHKSIYG